MTKEEAESLIEIKSRLKYVTDPKAQNIWNFLVSYLCWTDGKISIPAYRVLDALSMINQDKIEYCAV